MKRPLLDKWSICRTGQGPWRPPECGFIALQGEVIDHPRFDNDSPVTTSKLLAIDTDAKVARTRSRVYDLGTIDPEFVTYMANAGLTLRQYEETIGKNVFEKDGHGKN